MEIKSATAIKWARTEKVEREQARNYDIYYDEGKYESHYITVDE